MDWRLNNWEGLVTDNGTKRYGEEGRLCLETGADLMLTSLRIIHSLQGLERMCEVILKPQTQTVEPLIEEE